ncbi:MAG: serine hydrolase [Pseudomonadota bacterium]
MKKLLIGLLVFIVLAVTLPVVGLLVTGHGYILTALQRTYLAGHTTANIDDYRQFDTRIIAAGEMTPWEQHPQFVGEAIPAALDEFLIGNEAVAFLVIYQGQILAEKYYDGYGARSRTNSFSVAKSVVSMLLGAAVRDGIVDSIDQPIVDFLPEFADDPLGATATLRHLSGMDSGYDWDEHYYSPFSPTVALLYSNDVGRYILQRDFTSAPGETFYYSSASTQLLTMALSRALARHAPDLTLSQYLSQTLWQPLGMNDDALWHLDGTGQELGYCCISTNARNFAKLAQMLLQDGEWQGQQVLPSPWVLEMRRAGLFEDYGLSLWLDYDAPVPHFAMRGHLGQYMTIVPSLDLVIVRLGRQLPEGYALYSELLPYYIEQVQSLLPMADSP